MISEMQAYCYGSVSELLEKTESSMPHYFKFDLINNMTENKDKIIALHRYAIREKRDFTISKMGIIITVIFGLPAIHDALCLIRRLFTFNDLKYISLVNASVTVWFTAIFVLLWYNIKHKT